MNVYMGARIWAPMPIYRYENPSEYVSFDLNSKIPNKITGWLTNNLFHAYQTLSVKKKPPHVTS